MNRREVLSALTGVAAAAGLAGCGGTSDSRGGTGADQTGKGTVGGAISFAWWGGASRNDHTNAVIKLYQQANPGVQVHTESTDFNTYFQKLNVEAAGKNLPDIPQMQARQLNDYTKRNTLLALDGMTRSGAIDVSGIPAQVLDTGRGADGKLYMVPYGAAYDGIMYNTALAQQAGVGDLPAGFTWDQWVDWLLRAQPRLPAGVKATVLDGINADVFISYVQSRGLSLFKDGRLGFDKSTLIDYWNLWERLRQAGATVSAATQAEKNQNTPIEQSDIVQGTVLSASTPGNALANAQQVAKPGAVLKMTTHPFGPKGIGNVLITSGLSISANCTNVPTAASFINFFTNDPAGAKAFSSDNGAVTVTKLLQQQLDDPNKPAKKKEELQTYQDIVAHKPPVIVYPSGYQQIFVAEFTRDYQDIAFGHKSVTQAVDTFFTAAAGILAQ